MNVYMQVYKIIQTGKYQFLNCHCKTMNESRKKSKVLENEHLELTVLVLNGSLPKIIS